MWQLLSTFDLVHSSLKWIQTILSCGKYSTTLYVDDIKLAEKKQNISPTWKNSWNTLIWENQLHSSTMFVWVALEENARSATKLWIIMEVCSNRGFLLEQWKIYQKQKTLGNPMLKRYLDGRVTWKVMQRNAWKDIANLRIKQLSNSIKSRRRAWMTINLRKKKLDQLENCP